MSTLIIDEDGKYKCTRDRLNLWKKEFERFDKMNNTDKEKYLDKIENKEKFYDLYNKGDNLDCGYSSNIVDVTPTYSVEIPDPMQVDMIEKKLGRKLTEIELEEGFIFYKRGIGKYTKISTKSKLTRDWIPFKINRIKFPDDCM